MLYGAIIGDIVGSRFERHNCKVKDFKLFTNKNHFTDDTIMTIAIYEACKAIKNNKLTKQIDIENCFKVYMQKWGKAYSYVGYGKNFKNWLFSDNPQPYNSYGNGSAMRVSAIGWLFSSIKKIEKFAEYSANPTHNHIEGIKGAKAIAVSIYLARTTHNKHIIKHYIKKLCYKLSKCNDIRPFYKFDVSCQGTVPVAIESFLESKNFEDAIRIAVSMGGDSDTIAAITGSIAEAYYGVPNELKKECDKYLDTNILSIIQ